VTEPVAISVRNASKQFRLHRNRPNSLKEAVLRRKRDDVDEFWALDDVTFDIPKGSFFGLIGHNGSGKSTLLRLMAGIHEPTSGEVVVDGRISALLELGSGFHPDLTGRENIFLNGAILGLSGREIEQSVDQIIAFSGLEQFIDSPVKMYSSGMHVRLGFAISVNVEPEILLIDEVIAVGDEEFQRRCFDHLYTLRRKGVTIVLVSHAAGLVESLCDRVAWLDHGVLQMVGDPGEVVRSYLERVNSQEAERLRQEDTLPSSPFEDVGDEGTRRGTGEIRVFRVEYLTKDRLAREAAATGEPFVIRLWYDASFPVHDPVFSIGLHHESGTFVAGPNSQLTGLEAGTIEPGKGYVDVEFYIWNVLPGQYYVSTAVTSGDLLHTFDAWDRSHKLIVQPGSSRERYGIVDMMADWHPPVRHDPGG
jgi:lipopolysaccharide transport system ATP-binding protein